MVMHFSFQNFDLNLIVREKLWEELYRQINVKKLHNKQKLIQTSKEFWKYIKNAIITIHIS